MHLPYTNAKEPAGPAGYLCENYHPKCTLCPADAVRDDSCWHPGEDDGYLVLFVYDERIQASEFVVYDAKTLSSKPVARVPLPQRVPYGFHGKHINAAEFQSQFPFDIHFLPDV